MIHHELFDVLNAIHPLTKNFKRALMKEVRPVSFERNHILLDAPSVAEFVYFIQRGVAMSYSFDKKKKIIDCFWQSGQIMTAVSSFCGQVPSTITIQVMSDTDLLCLSYAALYRLLNKYKEAHILYHKIVAKYHRKCQRRIHEIQNRSAAHRLDSLTRTFPDLEQFVSQENIASYLGITPQSLSRIKRSKGDNENEICEV